MNEIYKRLLTYQQQGIDAVLVTAVRKQGEGPVAVGKKMLVSEDEQTIGTVGGGTLELTARKRIKKLLKTRENLYETYLLNDETVQVKDDETTQLPMICGGEVSLFYEFIGALEHVTIFGGGHVGQAVLKVLKTMNFHVTVVDHREVVLKQNKEADATYEMPFVDYIDKHGLKPNSVVVVCTPNHEQDYHVINKVISDDIELKYIGMLCSPEKLKDYMDKTYETFGSTITLKNLYAPIGLDLGGGSPEEIAISIVSEILWVSHGKQALRHMRETVDASYRYWKD